LVEQPGLDRDCAVTDTLAKLGSAGLGSIGTEARGVGIEHRPAQTALVAQGEPTTALEVEREPVPAPGSRLRVHHETARHAEVEAEHGAGGVDPQHLPLAVGGRETVTLERRGNLPRRVRAADVGVGVVDGDDRPSQGVLLDDEARALGLR
jgi:hypothetical protein